MTPPPTPPTRPSTACSSQNVDAIIGAASSGVSLTVIDKITGAGVVQFSPANTSKTLSDYPDKGLYFRTAPSDILQGAVLGEVIAGDGAATVAIVARNDSYGTGLAEDATAALEEAGVEVVETVIYAEDAQTFDAEVARGHRRQPRCGAADRLRRGLEDPDHDGGAGRRAEGPRRSTARTASSATPLGEDFDAGE